MRDFEKPLKKVLDTLDRENTSLKKARRWVSVGHIDLAIQHVKDALDLIYPKADDA